MHGPSLMQPNKEGCYWGHVLMAFYGMLNHSRLEYFMRYLYLALDHT